MAVLDQFAGAALMSADLVVTDRRTKGRIDPLPKMA